jgi:hypothetical protein
MHIAKRGCQKYARFTRSKQLYPHEAIRKFKSIVSNFSQLLSTDNLLPSIAVQNPEIITEVLSFDNNKNKITA